MKLSTFFAIAGAIAVLFGAGFLALPELSLRQYGVPTDPHNLMQARYFGVTLLQVGLVVWLARRTRDGVAARAMLVGIAVGNVAGAAVSAWAAAAGLQNAMAWGSVLLYAVLAAGSVYFLVARPTERAAAG